MNKKRVDELIPAAYLKIKTVGIADENGVIEENYRGQISSFGSALTMGSLLSAVAFFCDKGSSEAERPKLMQAIWLLLDYPGFNRAPSPDEKEGGKVIKTSAQIDAEKLFSEISRSEREKRLMKAKIIDAAIALKLAMNLYRLEKKGGAIQND